MPSADERLDVSMLETWLWDAACAIRGATDAPKFKDFILPLVFYKRLSDVYADELAAYVTQFGGDETLAREIIAADQAGALRSGRSPIVRFYMPRLSLAQDSQSPRRWRVGRIHFLRDARGGAIQSEAAGCH